jgi:hypothetical protein
MKTNTKFIFGKIGTIAGLVLILWAPVATVCAGNLQHIAANGNQNGGIARDGLIEASFYSGGWIAASAVRLTDEELNQIRGGLGKFSFGISFAGIFDKLGNLSGKIFSGNDSVPQELIESSISQSSLNDVQPVSTDTVPQGTMIETAKVDGANISAYVGNFDGASGIFQISQSPGSYNVITNNMTINISIYNYASESQASGLIPRFLDAQ